MSDGTANKPWGMELNTFCMLMHLSQFVSFALPGAGIILPIVMWAMNKDDFPLVDEHGKVLLNWILSVIIYSTISLILMFVFIGFLAFLVLLLCTVIFVILAAVKAYNGTVWSYPLSIKFFK